MKGKKLSYKEKVAVLREKAEERRKIFKALCKHVGQGYSKECFTELSRHHIEEFFEKYPLEFCVEEFNIARQEGQAYWESLGRRQSDGTCLGNSRTWFYNMAMRYGWTDRVEVKAEHKGAVAVNIVNYGSQHTPQSIVKQDDT